MPSPVSVTEISK